MLNYVMNFGYIKCTTNEVICSKHFLFVCNCYNCKYLRLGGVKVRFCLFSSVVFLLS